jgi:hypothetical protein
MIRSPLSACLASAGTIAADRVQILHEGNSLQKLSL